MWFMPKALFQSYCYSGMLEEITPNIKLVTKIIKLYKILTLKAPINITNFEFKLLLIFSFRNMLQNNRVVNIP